ncbi:flagellar motor protein MotB [Vibrio penaeicida]|uniref:OmpA/MotB family protein n=1 Tax=Vibrio penaeicida TaxID=104609 RepID=UPI0027357D19|nr:flagellar motor protein MotB [Vibrio penaeicida]MDP2571124.1 flagellar motor protein MotB [Vibrio penaeicida]
MSRRRQSGADVREENDWLVTYSDFITLLMTFFIVILATSQIGQGKFEELKASWSALSYRKAEMPMTQLIQALEQSTEREPISLTKMPDGIKVDFDTEALYEEGSATLSSEGVRLLTIFASSIENTNLDGKEIVVEGHTDDLPIHNDQFDSNWELSGARAIRVTKQLISLSVDKTKMSAVAYADTYPTISDSKELAAQRKANRRVSIYIKRSTRH